VGQPSVRIPVMPSDFSLSESVQSGCKANPATSSVGTDGSFPRLGRLDCEFFCLPSSGAVVGMNGSVPFVLHSFVVWTRKTFWFHFCDDHFTVIYL
jgi:hypothetical protein